jgi:hypothetical protein
MGERIDPMRILTATLATLLLLLAGCASLQIQDDDYFITKTGKVLARIPLALVTIGLSEVTYACDRSADPAGCYGQARQGYRQGFAALQQTNPPLQQTSPQQRTGCLLCGRPNAGYTPAQRPPPPTAGKHCTTTRSGDYYYTHCQRNAQSRNCTTSRVGDTYYTNCY